MKLKFRFFLLMAAIFCGFMSLAWFLSEQWITHINEKWGSQIIEKQVAFDKYRTLSPLIREIELARKMAAAPGIIQMALHEDDPVMRQHGIATLEQFRFNFADHSYFAAFAKSGNYYFNDANDKFRGKQLRYVLSSKNPNDQWFYATLAEGKDYQVNLDPDVHLGVTKVWINVLIKNGSNVLGIVGTGIDLSDFLKSTVNPVQKGIDNMFIDKNMSIQLDNDPRLIDYMSIAKDAKQRVRIDRLLHNPQDVVNLRQLMQQLDQSPEQVKTLWVDFKGEKYLLGVAYLPEVGWYDLTLMDEHNLALVENIFALPALFGTIFLIALVVVVQALRHWILSPISVLQRAIKKIQQGQYELDTPLVGVGEIRELSAAFASMVSHVRDTNRGLENMVDARTLELRSNKEKLQAILSATEVAIAWANENGEIEYINQKFISLFGYTLADVPNIEQWYLHAYPDAEYRNKTVAEWDEKVARSLPARTAIEPMEVTVSCKDGSVRHALLHGSWAGTRLLATFSDITARKYAENALLENEKKLRGLFELSPLGIALTDMQGNYIEFNEAFRQICGYSADELRQLDYWTLTPRKYEADEARQLELLARTGHYGPYEKEYIHKDGTHVPLQLNGMLLTRENGEQFIWSIVQDISERKKIQEELSRIANFDMLTSIPNRVLLADKMKLAIEYANREQTMMAVCYLDLDGFKPINDNLGHDAGDQVLVEVAKRIGENIRDGDTVARLGGDEFVVLLSGLTQGDECVSTLEKLLQTISEPITVKGRSVSVSTSIGVSIFPLDDEDPDTLLRHADQAMYVAKQTGKNRFHIYDIELERRTKQQSEFQKTIQYGLEQGQFELFYQPKINLRSKQLVGAEALIRWHHPEQGLLGPAEFLRYIENTELDIQLGEWVMGSVLAQMQRWHDAGLGIEVSLNISGYHLESAGFVDRLRQQLANYPRIRKDSLQIEVLETVALNDIDIVKELIDACHQLGVGFALDDFGTGYSSLSYLSSLPVDTLKIDQSFVRDMLDDQGDKAIVQGILALAQAFNRVTVAEGIETLGHYRALLEAGCELGQGYFIARPMPVAEFERWRFEVVV